MKKVFGICCLGFLLSLSAFAKAKPEAQPSLSLNQLKTLAAQYYLQKANKDQLFPKTFNRPLSVGSCQPGADVGSCVNSVCKHLPNYLCDDPSELQQIARSCANNYSGACVDSVCSHLPNYQCDDLSELTTIAQSCAGSVSGACVESVCKHLPNYQCDDLSEIQDIAKTCSGLMDGSCVDSICSHMPNYQCDDASELKQIVNACKNP